MKVCRVSTWSRQHFVKYIGIYGLVVVAIIIIGAVGPKTGANESYYANNCKDAEGNPKHSNMACHGAENMNNANATMVMEIMGEDKKGLSLLNRGWALIVGIYSSDFQNFGFSKKLEFQVKIEGRNSPQDSWTTMTDTKGSSEMKCTQDIEQCANFTAAIEEYIFYRYNRVSITFLNSYEMLCVSGTCYQNYWIGDVEFTYVYASQGFSNFSIAFVVIFLMISGVICGIIWNKLRGDHWATLGFDKKAVFALSIGAVCYVNPFLLIEYGVRGWFMSFLTAILEVSYLAIFWLFLLLSIDKIRKEELAEDFKHFYLPKFVVVGFYSSLMVIAILIRRLTLEYEPVVQDSYAVDLSGSTAFFIMAGIVAVGMGCWLGYLIYKAGLLAKAKPEIAARFGFIGVPAVSIMVLQFIALAAGAFSPMVNHSPVWLLLFMFLHVSFSWLMCFGLWPIGVDELDDETQAISHAEVPVYADVPKDNEPEAYV